MFMASDVMREQLEVMAFPPKPCGSICEGVLLDLGRVWGSRCEMFCDVSCVRYRTKGNPLGCQDGHAQGRRSKGRRDMSMLLGDLLLFSCLAVWVSGIVIAIASLLG